MVIAGNFDEGLLRPLINKYLASIPTDPDPAGPSGTAGSGLPSLPRDRAGLTPVVTTFPSHRLVDHLYMSMVCCSLPTGLLFPLRR